MGLINQQQKPAGRKANAEEQAQYKMIVTQVVKFMAQPKVREMLKQSVDQMGAEKALAMVLSQALNLVGQAAKNSGAKVAMHTGSSALKEIVTLFVTMLASAGKVEDIEQSVQMVMQMILKGGQQMPPQQQPMAQPQPGM